MFHGVVCKFRPARDVSRILAHGSRFHDRTRRCFPGSAASQRILNILLQFHCQSKSTTKSHAMWAKYLLRLIHSTRRKQRDNDEAWLREYGSRRAIFRIESSPEVPPELAHLNVDVPPGPRMTTILPPRRPYRSRYRRLLLITTSTSPTSTAPQPRKPARGPNAPPKQPSASPSSLRSESQRSATSCTPKTPSTTSGSRYPP